MGIFAHLILLFILLSFLFSSRLQAIESHQKVILYTPYTKISVPPGETINYSIDVINEAEEIKTASLHVEGLPRGWKYEIKAGSWNISQLAVLPHEKRIFL